MSLPSRRLLLRTVSPLTLAATLGTGCLLVDTHQVAITYDLDPQEFAKDLGTQSGTVPSVDCSVGGDAACAVVPAPSGSKVTCDSAGTKKCQLTAQIALSQSVNLSTEQSFPSSVANSSAINSVTVNRVAYWVAMNSLTFATPPLDIFVGPQTAQSSTDPGVVKLGTVPSLPAGQLTACRPGASGTKDSFCEMPLDDDGKAALAGFAKDYKTPFNVFVAGAYTAHAGDAIPSGKIDIWVQPEIGYAIPLTK